MVNFLTHFFDVECMKNVFTVANFKPEIGPHGHIDMYILSDDLNLISSPNFTKDATDEIYRANPNFKGTVHFYNLHRQEHIEHLAKSFGLSNAKYANNPNEKCSYEFKFRLVCDTDSDYDNTVHPYLMGYNSQSYDTTVLAHYLYSSISAQKIINSDNPNKYTTKLKIKSISASELHKFNDVLFSEEYKNKMHKALPKFSGWDGAWLVRKNMLMSGRHIDISRINEKQHGKVGLKRLLGMLGHQILEPSLSNWNTPIKTEKELFNLIAYNVSDVVNLQLLFNHKDYTTAFNLKKSQLETYPELVYEKKIDEYAPDICPTKVREYRLNIDSTSAQFASNTLCPYGNLTDIETVSFVYPHPTVAKELGIESVNVLEESKKFFYDNISCPKARKCFDKVYDYYKTIEGKNFNDGTQYQLDYPHHHGCTPDCGCVERRKVWNWQDPITMPKDDNNLFYYLPDGTPTSCFATFSVGGIHGAECAKALFDIHMQEYKQRKKEIDQVKKLYPNPADLKAAKKVVIFGIEYPASKFIKSDTKTKEIHYKDIPKPILFKKSEKDGSTKLQPKYAYTSGSVANHEDFVSYYPNLLRRLHAFHNEGLGYDRYAEILKLKDEYGRLKSDKSLPKDKRKEYAILQSGTKLILNSASGAGDAKFDNSIKMSNNIISMRCIGQMFLWRIGQAQALKGGIIISTNTDGLYTVLDAETNDKVLKEQSALMNVDIEPERTLLITKDTNNRLEVDPKIIDEGFDELPVFDAKGGTLACIHEPTPDKSLVHAAILDWALAHYLVCAATGAVTNANDISSNTPIGMMISKTPTIPTQISMDQPLNRDVARQIFEYAIKYFEPRKLLNMFQIISSSSIGSVRHVFAVDKEHMLDLSEDTLNPNNPYHVLQQYNRFFVLKPNTPNTIHIFEAQRRKITDASRKKRIKNKQALVQHCPLSTKILKSYGVCISTFSSNHEAVIAKKAKIEPEWAIYIENRDIYLLPQNQVDFLLENLDIESYINQLESVFNKNWQNKMANTYEYLDE